MHIDIVSDVICPWCFIGKRRRLGAVIGQLPHILHLVEGTAKGCVDPAAERLGELGHQQLEHDAEVSAVRRQLRDGHAQVEGCAVSTAAGVTPGMREAWARVRGWTWVSFSCISRESPLTER